MDTISDRQAKILGSIVREFVRAERPISSEWLHGECHFAFSGATIRNEMQMLEDLGLIEKPHTSGGRVPTQAGYRYYIDELIHARRPSAALADEIGELLHERFDAFNVGFATRLAAIAQSFTLVTVGRRSGRVNFAGLSKLVSQPEFHDARRLNALAELLDDPHELLDELDELTDFEGTRVFVGSESDVTAGFEGAMVLLRGRLHDRPTTVGVLGPARMDYDRTVGLLDFIYSQMTRA